MARLLLDRLFVGFWGFWVLGVLGFWVFPEKLKSLFRKIGNNAKTADSGI